MDEKKSRYFNLLLYPDNPQHNLTILELQTDKYMACGICHDSDVYEDDTDKHAKGELKKKHFHFVVKFKNPRYKSGLAKDLDIEERFIDITKSFKNSSRYLLHFGDDSKYQYNADDLVGTLRGEVIRQLDNDKPSETETAVSIFDYIKNEDRYLKITDLYVWACQNGCYSHFRRNYSVIKDIIYEHNERFYKKEHNL